MGKEDKEDSGFGFKDKAKAEETLRLLEQHELNYRRLTVRGLLGRAKRTLSLTKAEDKIKNIKEAMEVFENWLAELDKNKEKKPDKKDKDSKKDKDDKNQKDDKMDVDDKESGSDEDKAKLPSESVPGLGFKDASAARASLDILKGRDPDYQQLAVKGLIRSAKRVLTCTRDETKLSNIKEGISVLEEFLDEFDNLHRSRENCPYLSVGYVRTAHKLAQNVSEQQKSFLAAYESVRGEYKRLRNVPEQDGGKTWDIVRNTALKELRQKYKEAKLFDARGQPTAEHLDLLLWGYSPEPSQVKKVIQYTKEDGEGERETWDDWETRSSLSQVDELASQPSHPEDVSSLRAERDALARALAAERQRAANCARAHDARLAELHGVIAELVRRRAEDKQRGIPEEEGSDECESTTQPAGELDNDADRSRTEQNESSSLLSPDLATPQEKVELPEDTDSNHHVRVSSCSEEKFDTSLNLSERDSELRTAARCSEDEVEGEGDSCEREHGSQRKVYAISPGRLESREAKIAARVKLKRTEDSDKQVEDNVWCVEAAEQLALDVCTQADLREAMLAADSDCACGVCASRTFRLRADAAVLRAALARAQDTAARLYVSLGVQEQACVSVCGALAAADAALEAYDVLLALAETAHCKDTPERVAAESVGLQLLARLESQRVTSLGEPLLSPGPWLAHTQQHNNSSEVWTAASERRLRELAARLKAETVALRPNTPPQLFSYHDINEEDIPKSVNFNMADMETAVLMQDLLVAREAKAMREAKGHSDKHKSSCGRRKQHWLHTQASETDL